MSSLYNSIEVIFSKTEPLNTFLNDANKYFAHITPKSAHVQKRPETLQEHIELVQKKFSMLCQIHELDEIIDFLIFDFLKNQKLENDKNLGNFAKNLFVNTIVFHDFGKINENFQASPEKMNNPFFQDKSNFKNAISTKHSSLGAYLFIIKHIEDSKIVLNVNSQQIAMMLILHLAYPIFKHHGKYLNDDFTEKIGFNEAEISCMKNYIEKYNFIIDIKTAEIVPLHLNKLFKLFEAYNCYNSFSLYALIRLNFSLLTASDYLATGEYASGKPVTDVGVLNSKRINEMYNFVIKSEFLNCSNANKINYNKKIYELFSAENKNQNPKIRSNENLNILRQEMAFEVINNIRLNYTKNLFYIEAPTGGGKTNLSMLAVIELLKLNESKINKVFYVFPFTTLITQTYSAIKEALGLADNEITQLHTKAGYKQKAEEEKDGLYSNEKQNYIDNLFVHYPFCLLSHVKFFDLLKTNEKEGNYLLHRIANSIVVIDELQSYNPLHWDKIIYFINHYAKFYNIKFILMSATLPKLGNLKVLDKEYVSDFVYLLSNAKQDYFLNPNFCERVSFDFELFERTDLKLNEIANNLLSKSKEYALFDFGPAKPLNSVYCIIEFIFKKTVSQFYDDITNINNGFFEEIFILSGTILEHRRLYIINFLKNPNNRRKRILLITTQVVEAGVDIDMDLGFKDRSMIDSEEQLAGRINRNVNKSNCILYLFNYNNDKIIYGQDKRYQETKKLSINDYKRILINKDFDYLYNIVFDKINFWSSSNLISPENHMNKLVNYKLKIESLLFKSVNTDFKLIDQESISCFLPLAVPITIKNINGILNEPIFSLLELNFLSENFILPNIKNEIEGSEVFDLYIDLIKNKKDFLTQKIAEKTLQGIMSKFIFSLFASEKVNNQLVFYADENKSEYGYKYIERWNEFYHPESGMNDSQFQANETQFL